MSERLNYWRAAPETARAVLAIETHIRESGLEPGLLHLVKLRASQINGCAFCIDMHAREAREDGESERRLYLLSGWRESTLFTPRERAALAWAEALTRVAEAHPSDAAYAELLTQFSEAEAVKLTVAIGVINTWNRLAIGFQTQHPPADAAA